MAYLSGLLRYWRLILVCLILSMAAGWITAPDRPQATPGVSYEATTVLVPTVDSPRNINLSLTAFLVTTAEVSALAAKTLKYAGDPDVLAESVAASADNEAGTVNVRADAPSRSRAAAISEAFASGTLAFLRARAQQERDDAAVAAQAQLKQAASRLSDLDEQIQSAEGNGRDASVLRSQRDAEATRHALIYGRLQDLIAPVESVGLDVLGRPTTTSVSTGGVAPPSSPLGRTLFTGAIGLVIAVLLALVVDRIDVRLRSREAVEEAFRLPVLAEIPTRSRRPEHSTRVLVTADPGGAVAEAYRSLRSMLLLMREEAPAAPADQLRQRPQVILAVSARAGDGKTSTVANLAAAWGETGRSTLVLDCDLRKPELHLYLDSGTGIGMPEVLRGDPATDLPVAIRPTAVPHVRLVTSSPSTNQPSTLLLRIGPLIDEARQHADLVLIDSTPALVANDINDIVPHVDAVLVVCRAGRITTDQAQKVATILNRNRVAVAGVVLIGTGHSPRWRRSYGANRGSGARERSHAETGRRRS